MKNFRKILFLTFALFSFFAFSQKIGVVDTKYILDRMPEYKSAEQRLNAQIDTWQKEIQNQQSEYEQKKAAFESEKVLLVGEQLRTRQQEVLDLEKSIKTTTSLRFGTNGEIAQLRANLVQPFQDQIWDAIMTISEKNGLGIVLDKSNNISVIFLHQRYDYTEKVLDFLTRGTTEKERSTKK